MALRDDWKKTGQSLGKAFGGLGKNVGRSVKDGVDKASDWADDGHVEDNETVFNDGSWRETGKDLGKAFTNLGKSIVKSAREGIDKVDDAVKKDD